MSSPPFYPYAPQRQRPLSLWNPLDYLVLLYWVFYFPQALRWYVETFSKLPADIKDWQAVHQDTVLRCLMLQGLLILIVSAIGLAQLSSEFGLRVSWVGVAVGIAVGVVTGIVIGMTYATKGGVVYGVALGVASGVVGGVVGGVALGVAGGVVAGVAFGVVRGMAWGIVAGMLFSVVAGVASGVVFSAASNVAIGMALGMMGGMVHGMAFGVILGMLFGVAFGMAFVVAVLRLDTALLGLLLAWVQPSKQLDITLQRVSPLPVWRLHHQLTQQLMKDWRRGLNNCEGLLRYSLQFGPIIIAIQEVLKSTPDKWLLSRITDWCSMSLHDWKVVLYQSTSLQAALRQKFFDGFFIIPRHWWPETVVTLRYDIPVRAACAGFWLLHEGDLDEAAFAFATVRSLPHGEELYTNVQALEAGINCKILKQINLWKPPPSLQGELLRPPVRAAFEQLAEVAEDIDLILHARSARQRNSALNRASGRLHGFPKELADCPAPERPQLEKIAAQWLDIILANANAIGSLEVREPVASPYIVGAPVPAAKLAGRQDIFAQIEAAWAKPGPRDSLVIFGHRRMGKTSVARSVPHLCRLGDDTRLAFLNLQTVDWTEGLSDLCYAIAFALWEADQKRVDEPAPEDYEQHSLAALRRLLSRLGQPATPRRYILVLDEYELLEEKLPDAVASDRTTLLRGLTQQHPWLALGLVGLHSLQERSASLCEAIFSWYSIPVGLMDRDAFADLLQIEEDAFPLEYSLDAIDRAYVLTGGQPFLGQLLGDSLVQRFNQQLKQQLEPPAPTFTAADVDAVVEDSRFYRNGHVYFNGIWAQAGESPPGQQTLLKILASHGHGLDQNAWQAQSSLDPVAFSAALDALDRHDVVICQNGRCRYTVELMRRWVAADPHIQDSNRNFANEQ